MRKSALATTIVSSLCLAATGTSCIDPEIADTDEHTSALSEENASGLIDYSTSPTGVVGQGVVMTAPKVYLIFYGKKWTADQQARYVELLENLSGSPAASVLTTYNDPQGHVVPATFTVIPRSVAASTTLPITDRAGVVKDLIASNVVPRDSNAVYMVLPDYATSSVDASTNTSLCKLRGGGHNFYVDDTTGAHIKYAWIVNKQQCKGAPLTDVTPNGDALVDLTAATVWHEYIEAVTDPEVDNGYRVAIYNTIAGDKHPEIGDVCAGGVVETLAMVGAEVKDLPYVVNGASANMHLGTRDYLMPGMWLNADRGGCVPRLSLSRPVAGMGTTTAGDFDGNGIADLLWRDAASNSLSIWLLDANNNSVQQANLGDVFPQVQVVAVADFNNDKKSDILLRDTHNGTLYLWTMNGVTTTTSTVLSSSLNKSIVVKAVGDFNGDGRADILFEDYTTSTYRYWLNVNGVLGAYSNLPSFSIPNVTTNDDTLGTGDFDGDGHADVLFHSLDDTLTYFYSFRNNSWQLRFFDAQGTDGLARVWGIADINHDGRADVIGMASDYASIAWTTLTVNNTRQTTPLVTQYPSTEWRFSNISSLPSSPPTKLTAIDWRNRQTGEVQRWVLLGTDFYYSKRLRINTPAGAELVRY